jgi:ABC-type Fe3+/spermidine/putrescine transport system ATPase subunit
VTLAVEKLTKRYAGGRGIGDVTLEAAPGEVVALIGPSGCGKTTLLRAVAGLLPVDSGRILLRGRDVTHLAPERRNVGLIFQNYALFPHLSVFENVAYGLKTRGADAAAIAEAVRRALALVDLAGRDGRIDQLSGGEQQRVAVARAVVTEPHALLLDEPLSNLDPNLRHRMRKGLREILHRLAIPSIHVTHDQEEALAMADRVAVLDAGRLVQIGPPDEIYRRPRTAFVARFVGAANVVRGRVVKASGAGVEVDALGGATIAGRASAPMAPGDAADLALRPETIEVLPPDAPRGFPATVAGREFLGASVELRAEAAGETLLVRIPSGSSAAGARAGDHVRLFVDPGQVHVMPA